MKHFVLLAFIALSAVPFVGACTSESEVTAVAEADMVAPATLGEKHAGMTLTYTEGKSVVIALASNPTTGYDWAVTATDKSFGYPTVAYTKSSSATGSGGTTKLTWATKSALGSLVGTHTVELSYQRAWEKKPIKVLTYDIEILPSGALKPILLTDADNKKAVSVKVGQSVAVALSANPTSGYKWQVKATDKTFGYPAADTFKASSGAVGAPGVQTLTWKTSGSLPMAGKHSVSLEYKRPGEASALKTFQFSVAIN